MNPGRNLSDPPTPRAAHRGVLLLSGGMITIGALGLLAGNPIGALAMLIGAAWLLIEQRSAA